MDNKKILILLGSVAAFVVFIAIILVIFVFGRGSQENIVLTFWGVFDDRGAFDAVIREFQKNNPNIRLEYQIFSYEDYEQGLVNALAEGRGPDIFMIHNTWLPKHINKMKALPPQISGEKTPLMTPASFQNQYVEVAYDDLVSAGQIYGVPLYVDTLALYYNKDIFNSAGITMPPKDWDEFNNDVQLTTKIDSEGNIERSGAAMGTARNINRSTDIVMALMIQSGIPMNDDDNTQAVFDTYLDNESVGVRTLKFYTDFASPAVKTYTWNDGQHYSLDSFAEGNLAMMFNYSHQVNYIKNRAPRLNFGVAAMPQVSALDVKNYANYWAVGVANNSTHYEEAWKFVTYLGSKEGSSMYLTETEKPSARRDLIDVQKTDPTLSVFATQALTAKSWYQPDNTVVESIFADMIDDVNFNRRSLRDALLNSESRVNVLMRRGSSF